MIYILEILDAEDNYSYDTLVFDKEEDYNEAKKLIEDYDTMYYELEDPDYEYVDGLQDIINKINLKRKVVSYNQTKLYIR